MRPPDLRAALNRNTAAGDEALRGLLDLLPPDSVGEALPLLEALRLRSFACGVLLSDLARLSTH